MDVQVITELQNALRTLSYSDNRLLPLVVDGVYGQQTREALRIFQSLYGPEPTGEPDLRTWDVLHDAVRKQRERTVTPLAVFPHPSFLLRPAEEDETVWIVAAILNALAARYPNLSAVVPSARYTADMQQAVRALQELHGLQADGVIDRATWNLLASLYNTRKDTVRG